MCNEIAETEVERARREGYGEGFRDGRKVMHAKAEGAYRERNKIVAALSKVFPSHLARHEKEDNEWGKRRQNVVYIQLPTGQVSWHIGDDELWMFAGLLWKDDMWDGHSTEFKYIRLAALPRGNTDKIMS